MELEGMIQAVRDGQSPDHVMESVLMEEFSITAKGQLYINTTWSTMIEDGDLKPKDIQQLSIAPGIEKFIFKNQNDYTKAKRAIRFGIASHASIGRDIIFNNG